MLNLSNFYNVKVYALYICDFVSSFDNNRDILHYNVLKVLVEKFSKPTLLKYCFLNDWKSNGKTKITVRIQTMWLYIDFFYSI